MRRKKQFRLEVNAAEMLMVLNRLAQNKPAYQSRLSYLDRKENQSLRENLKHIKSLFVNNKFEYDGTTYEWTHVTNEVHLATQERWVRRGTDLWKGP
jgi:hypothetical protein